MRGYKHKIPLGFLFEPVCTPPTSAHQAIQDATATRMLPGLAEQRDLKLQTELVTQYRTRPGGRDVYSQSSWALLHQPPSGVAYNPNGPVSLK